MVNQYEPATTYSSTQVQQSPAVPKDSRMLLPQVWGVGQGPSKGKYAPAEPTIKHANRQLCSTTTGKPCSRVVNSPQVFPHAEATVPPDRFLRGPYTHFPNPYAGGSLYAENNSEYLSVVPPLSSLPERDARKEATQGFREPAPPPKRLGNLPRAKCASPTVAPQRKVTEYLQFLRAGRRGPLSVPASVLASSSQTYALTDQSQGNVFLTDLSELRKSRLEGFERLNVSLERLFARLDDELLQDKWTTVSNWVDQFHNDSDSTTLAEVCKDLLSKCYAKDAYRKHPNQTMTSICCALLEQLFKMLERFQPALLPVCRSVKREILGAIFVGGVPGETSHSNTSNSSGPGTHSSPNLSYYPTQAIAEESLCSAADSYMYVKTYYTLVRDVANRIDQAEDEIQETERRREKQCAVLDRGITFWQVECQKLILKAWKAHLGHEREKQSLRNELERLSAAEVQHHVEMEEQEKTASALRHQHRKELADLNQKIDELTTSISQLKDSVRKSDEEKQTLKDKDNVLQARTTEWTQVTASLQQEIFDYQQLLTNITRTCMEGPAWEASRQDEFADFQFTDKNGTLSLGQLQEWINAVTEKVDSSGQYSIPAGCNLLNSPTLLDNYACVLHYLSPQHLSEADLHSCLAEVDTLKKAGFVFGVMSQLGLAFPFTADDIILPEATSGPLHVSICTSLFHRFSDSTVAVALSQPQLSAEGGTSRKWENPPKTVQEWTIKVDQLWERCLRWRGLATVSVSLGTEVLTSHLTGRASYLLNSSNLTDDMRGTLAAVTEKPLDHAAVQRFFPDDEDERTDTWARAKKVLTSNFRILVKIFNFYSSSNSREKDTEISTDELLKLVQDAKLKSVTRDKVNGWIRKATGAADSISIEEYIVVLLQLAYESKGEAGDIAARLDALLQNNIIANCQWTDSAEFREALYKRDIQDVLKAHREFASQVFVHYTSGGLVSGSAKKKCMKMETFVDLINDLHIIDSVLTHEAVKQIFLKMQVEASPDTVLDFQEYLFSLCAVAAFKNPAPYLPLCRRIARFFDMWFVPTLSPALRRKF
ncbi:hypothetical protein DIPPA_64100 [Diplonema papillatum]|nr:hypothetical protein DIPPA_64100 [Diplonema papillatum]